MVRLGRSLGRVGLTTRHQGGTTPGPATDAAKVDGLAAVLAEAARARQVIVFTHDDRRSASIRRMRIAARVVTVRASVGSAVEVVYVGTPVLQALSDALVSPETRAPPTR